MGHALLDDEGRTGDGGEKVTVGGPIEWADDDAHAVIYVMVCQAVEHEENTVAREVTPLSVNKGAPRWDIEAQRRSGPAFTNHMMAAASALAIFTNDVGELASYAWTDCVHLHSASSASQSAHS